MTFFVLTFWRENRRVTVEAYDSATTAKAALVDAEQRARADAVNGEIDVVMLVAQDEDDLRRTHRHYFEGGEELLATS